MAVHNRYNGFRYNEGRYNVQDLILYFTEAIAAADARMQTLSRPLVDAMILVDSLTKSITNKLLTDVIKLKDWLSIKKDPADPWVD